MKLLNDMDETYPFWFLLAVEDKHEGLHNIFWMYLKKITARPIKFLKILWVLMICYLLSEKV